MNINEVFSEIVSSFSPTVITYIFFLQLSSTCEEWTEKKRWCHQRGVEPVTAVGVRWANILVRPYESYDMRGVYGGVVPTTYKCQLIV